MQANCLLCTTEGGELIWQNDFARIILADEAGYPGLCRVILNAHRVEMSDLTPSERTQLMNIVWEVERIVRQCLKPHKINLASLGNMVPHVHWHIIPRWENDPHFPAPIWATAQRQAEPMVSTDQLAQLKQQLMHIVV
ncbi:HIT family protein [uncultured Deefgea sp.]|uniref:HIT family protein n=1 Tax=uncultured Deefgea sp. TaxID=1304914 RepID=UPI002599950B|nr:HIT family protein [uncultured Deefgea sp.]